MAFSDFQSIEQVIQKYPLKMRQQRFLPDIEMKLPDWLIYTAVVSALRARTAATP